MISNNPSNLSLSLSLYSMSGTRIVNALAMQLKPGEYGCAGICYGGGGALSVVIQAV